MRWFLSLIFFVFFASACADESGIRNIYTPDETVQYYNRDIGDCVDGCATPYVLNTDLYQDKIGGLFNTIDDQCHSIGPNRFRPDVDVVGIGSSAFPAGQAVEISIEPAPYSIVTPVFSILDQNGRLMTVAFPKGLERKARASLLLPSSLPIFAAVESAENYKLPTQTSCDLLKKIEGGASYGYILKVKKIAGVPGEDLQKLNKGDLPLRRRLNILNQGDIHYYYFRAPQNSLITVTVKASTDANAAFSPVLSGLKMSDKSLEWLRLGNMLKESSNTLIQSDLSAYPVEGTSDNLYGFVLLDFNGGGGTDYGFDLSIEVK